METRAKQEQTRLDTSTHLKLLKRQLHEWKTLLRNQKQVRQWIWEEPISLTDFTTSIGMSSERIQRWSQLSLLMIRQSEERQRLHRHHQQEVSELNQVLAMHQPGLASS